MIKAIFVKHGQRLSVECLKDGMTGQGFFILKDDEGNAVKTSEILTAEGVLFTTDESKLKFSLDGIEYQIYLVIKDHLQNGDEWGIDKKEIPIFGEVKLIQVKHLSTILNSKLGLENNVLSTFAIGKICRSLGFRCTRMADGYAVILEEQDLLAAGSHFDLASAPSEDALAGND